MHALSQEQKTALALAIVEDSGLNLDYRSFIEVLLGIFEDLPGLEDDKHKVELLDEMWHLYDGLIR